MPHETKPSESSAWVKRRHPDYDTWRDDEHRMRATVHARRSDLAHYLVPHRFEGEDVKKPEKLDRAGLGYGISLNESYLHEILGHIRGASATYRWGPLADTEDALNGAPPEGTVARRLWEDVTRENVAWRNFFGRDVAEWMLSTPGGLILTDMPMGRQSTEADAQAAGRRPYARLVPMSQVLDVGRSGQGFRYVKLLEVRDTRTFDSKDNEMSQYMVVYRMNEARETVVTRWTEKGEKVTLPGQESPDINLGTIVDRQGQPALPLVPATFGRHPDVPWLGSGLLMGLDDIVIDLFNTVNEMRAGYRDLVIALLVASGEDAVTESIEEALQEGSRLVSVGVEGDLTRLAADSAEVDAGVTQIEVALKAWAHSAKRKAADAMERSQPRSGISLQAEFQLDLAPLLREVTEQLDDVESNVMHRMAQMQDVDASPDDLRSIGVRRDRNFRPEEEASRIARLVDEFRDMIGIVPAEAKAQMVERWLEASGVVDMDQEVETEEGERPLREVLTTRIEDLAEMSERQLRQRASMTGPLVQDNGAP